ncbi:MAG: hypothetical protein A2268_16790 [Candidatus Raymondbacteria bacterium RifOxyA12_full_50_37]|uniref:HTH lacI-type domain-containing protein n=1 Tax=Candidatus Raymondbacteria bacterium RIFOXYD12_FULL_49_13 TaxID=1817890 RepID=A0A1F7FCX9_UNCRA|nr:MAG: hypothetical protein A2268_16790 [Candidatus Raymondbacteria bacterium RifOxyA12_full_50_37]OGJ86267.1 MAG: hypothetical protein A2248_16385 [Candidatus Raymondbacteria bacterium RIFOXYA2_FULL_49_16]OGJ95935.1 MAG: hypothetical protein A2350_15915 [Candidatus Raymondbacteria bacterium RifOxyB12_full_50_8]OGK04372.1 MAG: hypothetical protein A2519_18360 [Candidatus Raymondbacteria bacterium RIFOXYD12_FULL_49_13]OGP42719.1 MAG: hypothetical protein A2324_00800 [Candidatus Raymondbacteria 
MAKKAGVSASTVSRALSGSPLISEPTRERIRAIAEKMAYTPNRQASLLARQKTLRLGFVVPYYKSIPPFSRSYFPALLNGLVTGAEEKGYSITIIVDTTGDTYKDLSKIVQSKEVDGLLLAINKINDLRIPELKKNNVPFVLINSYGKGFSSVDNNPLPGMTAAFEHLISLGHTTIGYISGDMHYYNAIDRLEAFKTLAEKFKVTTQVEVGNFSKTSGYYCAGKLLQGAPVTAIMTSSDREALGVLEYCRDHAIAIPDKVSVIGFDDLDPAAYVHPALTTIDNPVDETGKAASQLLIDTLETRTNDPRQIRLDTGFIIRQSTGKPHG